MTIKTSINLKTNGIFSEIRLISGIINRQIVRSETPKRLLFRNKSIIIM